MLKEETVRQVMIKYFKSQNIEVIPQRGAGPDLHIKGKGVVEVKGSKYAFDRLLRQLADYATKYNEVALALPYDGLTLERIEQLHTLFFLTQRIDSELTIYVIAPTPEGNNSFYVQHFKRWDEVEVKMSATMRIWGLDLKQPASTIKNAVENLIKYSPIEMLKDYVCMNADNTTLKVQI